MKNTSRSASQRQRFFDKHVHMDVWKEVMTGKNEESVITILDAIGYKEHIDYKRQHPVGQRFVIDFAFVNEQVALEVDGKSHQDKKQKQLDAKRDKYLFENGWVSIRLKDSELFGFKRSMYKNLIHDVVEERREQYNKGMLYPLDFNSFIPEDYD